MLEGGDGELVVASGPFVNEFGEASERDCVRSGVRPDGGEVKKGKRKPKRKFKRQRIGLVKRNGTEGKGKRTIASGGKSIIEVGSFSEAEVEAEAEAKAEHRACILKSRASVVRERGVNKKLSKTMPWYGVIVWWRDSYVTLYYLVEQGSGKR